jgi:regulator of protease activity HflC (stomatin/prohibitin superfamily)
MEDNVLILVCGLVGCVLLYAVLMSLAIRIVPETQRLVIFRLGRYLGVRGPGLVLVIPVIDRGIKIDLREQERNFSSRDILSADKYAVTADTHWHYKVTDPMESVLKVGNIENAAQEEIVTCLREAIGKLNVHDLVASRGAIAEEVLERLNAAAGKWGIQATQIELREITLPREAQEAVQRGRTRQAALLGSVGDAKSPVYTEGSIELYGETWNATSQRPIAPGKKVRVSRVVLEVEEL